MRKKYFWLLIILLIVLCVGFAFSKYVVFSEQDVTVVLKDATINETQITITPGYWTNNKVTVTIESDKGGEIYYKVGESGTWTKYSSPFDVFENDTVYSKLEFNDGSGPETLKDITNIDKTPPTTTAPTGTATTNQITITCNQTDGQSGIDESTIEYGIYRDGEWKWSKNPTFEGLKEDTEYQIKTRVMDNTGNGPTESLENTIKTNPIEESTLTFKKDNNEGEIINFANIDDLKLWVNTNIHITVNNSKTEGVTTSYKVVNEDGIEQVINSDGVLITTTGKYIATVTTSDGVNEKTVTYYMYVDKTMPSSTIEPNGGNYFIPVGSENTTVTSTISAADEGGSGVSSIQYAWSTSNITTPETWTNVESGTQISESLSGGTHYLWTKVTDNAGNTQTKTSAGFKIGYTIEYDANGGDTTPEPQGKEHDVNIILSEEITRTGYDFKEWNTDANGSGTSYAKSEIYTENKSIKLYAIWIAKTYNITYDLNGGTINNNDEFKKYTSYTYGSKKVLPTKEDVTKPGYELDYWYDEEGNEYTTLPVGTVEDINLTAHWKPTTATYTVYHYVENIDDEGYTLESTDSNIEGITESILVLEDLKKTITGATYKQGSTTEGGTPVTTVPINGDSSTKIYLYYARNTYTLTVNKNSDIGSTTGSGIYKYGKTVGITAEFANLPGYDYTWEGWTSNDITVPTEQNTTITMPAQNVIITANASKTTIDYSITYDLDGGSLEEGVTNPSTFTVETEEFTLNNPTKTGYTFAGWDDGEGNVSKNVTISLGTVGNKNYTAKWTINSYNVIYDYATNGGTNATKTSDTKNYNEEIDLAPTATKTGYTFVGWNTNKDATTGLTSLTMETNDITLYAIFSKEITVTYKANGGIEDITQKYTLYNNQTELSITTPTEATTYSDWEFLCYGNNASATTGYGLNETITAIVPIEQNTLTYYTNWKKDINVKFIDYKDTTKTITENNIVAYNGEPATVTAPAQNTYTGWTPKGWTTVTTTFAVGTNVNGGTFTGITTDIVYYGLYEQTIELSYNLNGGTSDKITPQTGTRKVNSSNINSISNPVLTVTEETPTKSGYKFVNWKDSSDNTYESAHEYTFTESTEITAVWDVITYKITYDLDDGNLEENKTNPSTYTVETETITLNNPTKIGYVFRGWQLEGETNVSNPCYINKGSVGDKKYIAIWDNGTDTKYKVEYYYQQNGVYSETATSSNIKTGTTEDEVTVTEEDKTPTQAGYVLDTSANNVFTGKIAADGSLVLKVYFKQQFTVKYIAGTHVSFTEEVYTGLDYGVATPAFQGTAIVDPGYEDGIWTPTITDTVTSDVVYILNSTVPKTDTPYKIEYYYQVNGSYSETATRYETRTGTTDTAITLSSGDKTPTEAGYAYDTEAENITTGKIAGDGSLVLKVYFKQQFTITYKAGNHVTFEDDIHTNIDYGTTTPEFNGEKTYDPGYSEGTWEPQIAETVTSDATYTLNATANTNTKYIVQYYYQQNGSYSDVPTSTDETRVGTTDTTISVIDSDKLPNEEGYVFDESANNILTGTIAGDESLVLKVYFKQQFTVKYVPGEKGTFAEEIYENLDYGKETPTFTGTTTGLPGYTFNAWSPTLAGEVTEDVTYTATWTANTNTPYKIEYYKQSPDNGQYSDTPTETDTSRTGTTDTTVDITEEINNNIPEGYALDSSKTNVLSGTIAGDGSLILKVYYKLQFTITYKAGNKVTFEDEVYSNLDYGTQTPEFKGTPNYDIGYGNGEWTPSIPELVTASATYTLNAIPNTDTKYKVEYYYQENGSYSDSSLSYGEIRTGTTDQQVSVTEEDKTPTRTGYVFDSNANNVLSGTIAGDGSLVLKIYFKQQFTIKYQPGEKGTFEEEIHENLDYGQDTPTFTGTTTSLPGYTFNGWNPTVTDTVTEDVTYTATWTANTNTPYTIHIYGENANDTGYTLIKDVTKTGTTDSEVNVDDIKELIENYGEESIIAKDAIDGNTITTITIKGDGSSELYLYYSRNTYTLNLAKGANIKTVTGAGTYKWGEFVQISAELEDDSGNTYNWLNWTSSNTALIDDQSEQTTTIIMPVVPENETLTLTANATATPNEYSITYSNLKGADNSKNPTKYTYGQTITLTNPGTIEGYDFEGWYADEKFTTQKTQILPTDKQNITLFAKWNVHKYTVTYNPMGGTCDTGIIENVEYGTQIDVTNIKAKKPNYVFKGWATTENSTTPLESLTMGEGDITLYAIYVEAVAQIENEYFETLQDAIDYAGTTPSTIIMLKSVTTNGITGNILEGQNIILNLNGKTIQSSDDTTIYNNGTLEITGEGKIVGLGGRGIYNKGTATKNGSSTIENANASSYAVGNPGIFYMNEGAIKMTVTDTSSTEHFTVSSTGNFNMNGGVIECILDDETTNAHGIVMSGNGTLNMTGGTIHTIGKAIHMSSNLPEGKTTVRINDGIIISEVKEAITNNSNSNLLILGGTISSDTSYGINNSMEGTVEIQNGKITSKGANVIYNNSSGTIYIKGGIIEQEGSTYTSSAIVNYSTGIINVSNGTITGTISGIYNSASGTVKVSGGTITGDSHGIHNNAGGTITVTGGTISGDSDYGISNAANGTVEIQNGTINSTDVAAIRNINGTIKISGGIIKSTNSDAIYNGWTGKTEISGGTIISENRAAIAVGNGELEITGGTAEGKTYGIWSSDSNQTTITIGEDDSSVSTSMPSIIGHETCGINIPTTATVNFYDGVMKGPTGKSIVGTVTATPTGYGVQKTTADNIETAILVKTNYAEYTSSGTLVNYYGTLASATANATSENTIKPLANVTETTEATVVSGKSLKIDMNGKTITLNGVSLTNNGTLTVTGTSGTLTSSANTIINGSASNSGAVFTKSGACTITGTATAASTINNFGTATLSAGTVSSTRYQAIYNQSTGKVTVSGATVTAPKNAIGGIGTAAGTSSPTVKVTSGSITSTNSHAISNTSTGTIYLTGGTIEAKGNSSTVHTKSTSNPGIQISGAIVKNTGTSYAINNESTGIVKVTSGTISANSNMAIYNTTTGTIQVSGGTITGGISGIHNRAAGTITVSGGTITGTTDQGVRGGTGIVSISGSSTKITGKKYGASVTSGTATITAGTIEATGGSGAYVDGGKLTIGTNETTPSVSTTVPSITGTTYGVQVSDGTFNFYDGVIKGPTGKSISGTVAEVPTGYGIKKTTSNNIETAILVKAYTVSYNANGGTGAPSTQQKLEGVTLTLSSTKPTRAGYTFKGWGTSSTATSVSYVSGASYTANAAITLYAIWEGTATFDLNYLDNSLWTDTYLTNRYAYYKTNITSKESVTDNSCKYGQYVELTMAAGTGGGPYYANHTTLTEGKTYTWSVYIKASAAKTLTVGEEQGGTKSVNVTTSWQKVTHTFTANDNTYKAFLFYSSTWAEGDKIYIHSLEIMEGTPATKSTKAVICNATLGTLSTPSRTGYTFQGWYTAPVGGTKISSSTKFTANTTYYAHWTTNNYTITYNYNGTKNYIEPRASSISMRGFSGSTNKCFSVGTLYMDDLEVGDKLTVTFSASYSGLTSASGQTAKLYLQGAGNTTSWAPGVNAGTKATWTGTGSATYTGTITLTETQLTNDYFSLNIRTDYYSAGSITVSNLKIVRSTTETVTKPYATQLETLPSPSETGYTLNGWYTAATGGTKISTTTTVTGNATYYAQWTAKTYTVTYDYATNGGTSATKTTATVASDELIDLTPTATKSGYTFIGWNTSSSATTKLEYLPMRTSNVTLYAIFIKYAEYTSSGTLVSYHVTLANATANATSGNTIKPLVNATETTTATVPSGKTLTIDMNGKTITLSGVNITNNGALTVTGSSGTLTSNVNTIINGSANNSNAVFTKSGACTIRGTGTGSSTINNYGTVTLSAGTVSSANYQAVYNQSTGRVTVSGATVTAPKNAIGGIGTAAGTSSPTVKVTSGSVTSTNAHAISNASTGTIQVSGGTITGGISGIHNRAAGTITVSGGTITGTTDQGVRGGTGIVSISGSSTKITGKKYGASVTSGTATITAGTIEATGGPGAYVDGGKLIIGTNETTPSVSTTVPSITGTTYGVQVRAGTFNFYDGVIKGPTGKSITGTVSATPTGYGVQKTTANSIETAILVKTNYAEYTSSGTLVNYYVTLANATANATSGNTIKPLVNATETTGATIPSGKTLTIDMNGKTITLSGVSLTNNGTLTVAGSSGTLTSNISAIYNGSSSNSSAVFTKSGACTINGTGGGSSTIINYAIVRLTAGTVSSTNYKGIYNQSTGKITISGATLSAKNYAIENIATTGSASIIVQSGTIKSTGQQAIRMNAGTCTVTGGTITSSAYAGVAVYGGTLTVGTNESTPSVSTTTPSITGATYGVYVESDATFNFYDGQIKGKTGQSIGGKVTNMPTGYAVYYSNDSTYEIATLGKAVCKIGNNGYTSLQNAINAVTTSSQTTIELLSDIEWTGGSSSIATISSSQNIILDLNGYNIYFDTAGYLIQNAGSLTITNSGTNESSIDIIEENNTFNYGTQYTIYVTGSGNVTVNENVTIDSSLNAIGGSTTGKIILNGGTLEGNKSTYGTYIVTCPNANFIMYDGAVTDTTDIKYHNGIQAKNVTIEKGTITIGLRNCVRSTGNVTLGNVNEEFVTDNPSLTTANNSGTIIECDGTFYWYSGDLQFTFSGTFDGTFYTCSNLILRSGYINSGTGGRTFRVTYLVKNATSSTASVSTFSMTDSNLSSSLLNTPNAIQSTIEDDLDTAFESNNTSKDETATNNELSINDEILSTEKETFIEQNLQLRLEGANNLKESHSDSTEIWKDLTENSNDANITEGTWGENYLEFNGTSSFMQLPEINSQSKTIQVTFFVNQLSETNNEYIISNSSDGGAYIFISNDGYLNAQFNIDGTYQTVNSSTIIEEGKIYDVAITYDGNTIKLYINGIEESKLDIEGTITNPEESAVMLVGANPNYNEEEIELGEFFNGKIYTISIYDEALLDTQIYSNSEYNLNLVKETSSDLENEIALEQSESTSESAESASELENLLEEENSKNAMYIRTKEEEKTEKKDEEDEEE